MATAVTLSAQQLFDAMYISAAEIQQRLKVARCALSFAHQRGTLPEPILVGTNTHVWDRVQAEPYLMAWELKLQAKRRKAE